MVEIRHISNHGKTRHGVKNEKSGWGRTTDVKFAQYVIIHGKGSKKKSVTFHGTKEQVDRQAALYE